MDVFDLKVALTIKHFLCRIALINQDVNGKINYILEMNFKTDETAANSNLGQCLKWKPQAQCG